MFHTKLRICFRQLSTLSKIPPTAQPSPPIPPATPSTPPVTLTRKEARLERKKELIKEIQKGYFHDVRDLSQAGGKHFIAPEKLLPANAPQFPVFSATSINSNPVHSPTLFSKHPATLVLLGIRHYSVPMLDEWRQIAANAVPDYKLPVLQISLVEMAFMRLFRWVLERSLRNQIQPVERQDTFISVYGEKAHQALLTAFDVKNKLVGYVCLVDRNSVIRWRAVGRPTSIESESLKTCLHELVEAERKSLRNK